MDVYLPKTAVTTMPRNFRYSTDSQMELPINSMGFSYKLANLAVIGAVQRLQLDKVGRRVLEHSDPVPPPV